MEKIYKYMKENGEVGRYQGELMGYLMESKIKDFVKVLGQRLRCSLTYDRHLGGSYAEFNLTEVIKSRPEFDSTWEKRFEGLLEYK